MVDIVSKNSKSLINSKVNYFLFRSSTEEDDDGSVCSCDEERQIGNAFPKAFEKDLITMPNLKKKSNHLLVFPKIIFFVVFNTCFF